MPEESDDDSNICPAPAPARPQTQTTHMDIIANSIGTHSFSVILMKNKMSRGQVGS